MSNEIKVNPTPIQRNVLDVAMELTQLYYKGRTVNDIKELEENFAKFHTLVCALHGNSYRLFDSYLNGNIKSMLNK